MQLQRLSGTTYHDDVSRCDADLIVAAGVKRIQRPVVDHLHRLLLLLLEAAD